MIFSVDGSIQKIIDRTKTQTRRPTDTYQVGWTYAIQPGRGQKAIPEGRIKIVRKEFEVKGIGGNPPWPFPYDITPHEANAEGGYTPEEFEALYEKMHPDWSERFAYEFQFIPSNPKEKSK